MKLALMQPTFQPWLGYFDLLDYVDNFVFFDTVQLNQQSWQTRNKIKVQNKELMVSVPIQKNKGKHDLLIKDSLIDFRKFDFRKKLLRTVEQNYKKSKFFHEVHEFIESLILFESEYLSEYNINLISKVTEKVNINTKLLVLSETDCFSQDAKGERVLDICNFFEVREYVSPLGSKEYLDTAKLAFEKDNIAISYQHYTHPMYSQLGSDFIPYIGIFDVLYNEGFENALNVIRQGRRYENS